MLINHGFTMIPSGKPHDLRPEPTKKHPHRHRCRDCLELFYTSVTLAVCPHRPPRIFTYDKGDTQIEIVEHADSSVNVEMSVFNVVFVANYAKGNPNGKYAKQWSLGFCQGMRAVMENMSPSQLAAKQEQWVKEADLAPQKNVISFPRRGS